MYVHSSGFRFGIENMTIHERRRYRLTPSREPVHNAPPIDPSLWLIHYTEAEPQNQHPSRTVFMTQQTRQLNYERNALQHHGHLQLQHKEFMLRDRDKWPAVNPPGNPAPSSTQQTMGYPNNVMAHMSQAHQANYMSNPQAAIAQGNVGPSPAKRQRHTSSSQGHVSHTTMGPLPVPSQEGLDEVDAGVGDFMDILTPQEISSRRYRQHHEWLEEILSSPYDSHQIIPSELGLGRKGELESLTQDFFTAHTREKLGSKLPPPRSPSQEDYEQGRPVVDDPPTKRVGQMPAGEAADFRQRAAQRMADMRDEVDHLKSQHAKKIARVKQGNPWQRNEQVLRIMTLEALNGNVLMPTSKEDEQVDLLTKHVETESGRRLRPIKKVDCVAKGGLEEKVQASAHDTEMGGSRPHSEGGQDTVASDIRSQSPALSPRPTNNQATSQDTEPRSTTMLPRDEASQAEAERMEAPADDWVMVNKEPLAGEKAQESVAGPPLVASVEPAEASADVSDLMAPDDGVLNFEGQDFDGGLDFSDLNTPGELSGYAQEIESMRDQQAPIMRNSPTNDDNTRDGGGSTLEP